MNIRDEDLEKKTRILLQNLGEEHLLNFADEKTLFPQIASFSPDLFFQMKNELQTAQIKSLNYEPLTDAARSSSEYFERGNALLKAGQCACIVLAGGEGSRLGFQGPKGCFPISSKGKSLFELLFKKVAAASHFAGTPLLIALMTSPSNHAETLAFLEKHAFFGLNRDQVYFFTQNVWPYLNLEGHLFFESKGKIAFGPNGNGEVFQQFVASSIYEKWQTEGIKMVNVIPVDNPLGDPFDCELFGFHDHFDNDVTAKVIFRKDTQEKVGVFVRNENHVKVIEYSELVQEKENQILYPLANTGLFCFSMDFINRASKHVMPLHRAKKTLKPQKNSNEVELSSSPFFWKFETFIFDCLDVAKKFKALAFPRDQIFAPLKNHEGKDSPETVRKALENRDREQFFRVTGSHLVNSDVFELPAEFYYPTSECLKKWKGKTSL
jgi:UDP-N-acetylglucosamine/UDP-N-acetylgalactosamine diphosphorylase